MKSKKANKIVRIVVVAILVLVLGVLAFSLFSSAQAAEPVTQQASMEEQAPYPAAGATLPPGYPTPTAEEPEYEYYIQTGFQMFVQAGPERLSAVPFQLRGYDAIVFSYQLEFDAPEIISREPREYAGRVLEFYSISRVDTDRTERRQHQEQIQVQTRTSDISEVMGSLYAV